MAQTQTHQRESLKSETDSSAPQLRQALPVLEVSIAVEFLCKYLEGLEDAQRDLFKTTVTLQLLAKYEKHWFAEQPDRGSAYRCLHTVSGKLDPLLHRAAQTCKVSLNSKLPENFCLWIDPGQVSCRLGEYGSVFPLNENNCGKRARSTSPPSSSSPTSSTSPSSSRKNSQSHSFTFVPCSPPLGSRLISSERRASPSCTSPSRSFDSACSSLSEDLLEASAVTSLQA